MNGNSIVAVENSAASSGSIVFWKLGGSVNMSKLEAAWKSAGLSEDLLPPKQEILSVLKRTMKDFETNDSIVKPIERDQRTQGDGFAVLRKQKSQVNGRALFVTAFEVILTPTGDLNFVDVAEGGIDEDARDLLCIRFQQEKKVIPHGVISGWLVSLAERCKAVGLRDTGGIYFIPKQHMLEWRTYVQTVQSCSSVRGFEIPAMHCKEAAEAVLDALNSEAAQMIDTIDAEMQKVGVRALSSRERKLTDYTAKLNAYAGMIGDKLNAVTQKINDLQGRVGAAILSNLDD